MEINEKSWHFRLVRFTTYQSARNISDYGGTLCKYFWLVVYAIVVNIFKAAGVMFLVWLFIYNPVSYIWAPDDSKLLLIFMWVSLFVLVGIVFAIFFIRDKLRNRNRVHKVKQPNIVIEYLRAKKQKFCPVIKIVK